MTRDTTRSVVSRRSSIGACAFHHRYGETAFDLRGPSARLGATFLRYQGKTRGDPVRMIYQ